MSGLLIVAAAAGGTAASYLFDDDLPLVVRVCGGVCVGLAALGIVGFLLAATLGLGPGVVTIAGLAVASPVLLLTKPGVRARAGSEVSGLRAAVREVGRRPSARMLGSLVLMAASAVVLWRVFARAAFVREGAWFTGIDHNIGDLPFHVAVIQGFALGDNFPPEHPELAGVRFTYPFVVDLVAAMLATVGAPLVRALLMENMVLALALLGLLYYWALTLTRDRAAALIAPALILLSGGLGWWSFLKELARSQTGLLDYLTTLPHDYTIRFGSDLRWGNTIITLLIPQRALLLGLPLFLIAWALWWRSLQAPAAERPWAVRRMLGAGLAAGLLPLIHAHSFAVLLAMGVCLSLLFRRRVWLWFFAGAFALALPQVVWLAWGHSLRTAGFLAWQPGWETGEGNVIGFWWKNTGLFIPLLVAALAWRRGDPPVRRDRLVFYLPFTLCFLAPNLLRLSPWIWDNIKFLFYWHVASAPLVALLLARVARRGLGGGLVAAVLGLALTLAGGLDVWRAASGAVEHRVFDRDGVAFAQLVADTTPQNSRFLIAPIYNHPVFLAGRRVLVGYDGHLWSQGLEYSERKRAVERIYAATPDAAELLALHSIDYAVVGPHERSLLRLSSRAFAGGSEVGSVGAYRLIRVER